MTDDLDETPVDEPAPIEPEPVEGAGDLPDDVKNGEITDGLKAPDAESPTP